MQTSAKKACFQFAECSFSYAKIRLSLVTSKVLGENVGIMIKKKVLCIQHNTAQKASPTSVLDNRSCTKTLSYYQIRLL